MKKITLFSFFLICSFSTYAQEKPKQEFVKELSQEKKQENEEIKRLWELEKEKIEKDASLSPVQKERLLGYSKQLYNERMEVGLGNELKSSPPSPKSEQSTIKPNVNKSPAPTKPE